MSEIEEKRKLKEKIDLELKRKREKQRLEEEEERKMKEEEKDNALNSEKILEEERKEEQTKEEIEEGGEEKMRDLNNDEQINSPSEEKPLKETNESSIDEIGENDSANLSEDVIMNTNDGNEQNPFQMEKNHNVESQIDVSEKEGESQIHLTCSEDFGLETKPTCSKSSEEVRIQKQFKLDNWFNRMNPKNLKKIDKVEQAGAEPFFQTGLNVINENTEESEISALPMDTDVQMKTTEQLATIEEIPQDQPLFDDNQIETNSQHSAGEESDTQHLVFIDPLKLKEKSQFMTIKLYLEIQNLPLPSADAGVPNRKNFLTNLQNNCRKWRSQNITLDHLKQRCKTTELTPKIQKKS